jgi:hypothetical protein
VIEVKYLRSHPFGSPRARPMHYGQLLADFNKVAQTMAEFRLVVLAADDGYVQYIKRSGRSLLPLTIGGSASLSPSSLDRLADTPRDKASSHGPCSRSPHYAPLVPAFGRLHPVRVGGNSASRAVAHRCQIAQTGPPFGPALRRAAVRHLNGFGVAGDQRCEASRDGADDAVSASAAESASAAALSPGGLTLRATVPYSLPASPAYSGRLC